MFAIVWIIVALLIAGTLVYAASLRTRRRLPPLEMPAGESLPKTPLQHRAALALLVITGLTSIAAAIVAYVGPAAWWHDDGIRLTVTAILVASLAGYLVFMLGVRALEARKDGSLDERDQLILGSANNGVGGAMLAVLAVWMIGLTETFIETRQMPTYFLYLVFWSCVMTNVISSILGILLAYRKH